MPSPAFKRGVPPTLNDLRSVVEIDPVSGCWLWLRHVDTSGYGSVRTCGSTWSTHRLAWVLANGPIADGMTVDHLCFVRRCANPEHLRLLTRGENSQNRRNILRETCPQGHPRSPENVTIETNGEGREYRACLICKRERYHRSKGRDRDYVVPVKTHCPHGHPYSEENTRHYRGRRFCKTCHRLRYRKAAA